jgi:hypothetical protein
MRPPGIHDGLLFLGLLLRCRSGETSSRLVRVLRPNRHRNRGCEVRHAGENPGAAHVQQYSANSNQIERRGSCRYSMVQQPARRDSHQAARSCAITTWVGFRLGHITRDLACRDRQLFVIRGFRNIYPHHTSRSMLLRSFGL